MDIALKYKIAERIIQSEDDTMLNEVKTLMGLADGDFWNELPNEVKQAIDTAKAQLNRGEGIPHEQVMAEFRSKYL